MGIREVEAAILRELRVVAKESKLRQKDIMEWSTGEIKAREDEKLYFLPDLKINVAVKTQI